MKTYLKKGCVMAVIILCGTILVNTQLNRNNLSSSLLLQNIEALALDDESDIVKQAAEKVSKEYESSGEVVVLGVRYKHTYIVKEVTDCIGSGTISCKIGVESCKITKTERVV